MTDRAEKLKAAHRGAFKAEPASNARLAALGRCGLHYERIDDFNVIVEGDYHFNPATSFWRSIGDRECCGYLVASLDAEIKRRKVSEEPAAGRDSIAAAPVLVQKAAAIAESAVGFSASSTLLPQVRP